MAEKRNIFLVGPMGAGKSTIGRHIADQLHLEFVDSDQEIERRTGAGKLTFSVVAKTYRYEGDTKKGAKK